jgi:hypothetical protein
MRPTISSGLDFFAIVGQMQGGPGTNPSEHVMRALKAWATRRLKIKGRMRALKAWETRRREAKSSVPQYQGSLRLF